MQEKQPKMLYQIKHMCEEKKHTLLGNNQSALKENEFPLKIYFKVVIFILVKWDLRTKRSLKHDKNRPNS